MALIGLVSAVCVATLIIVNVNTKIEIENTKSRVMASLPPTLRGVLKNAIRDGGSIVWCDRGVCENLADDEEVSEGTDGLYVSFDGSPDADRLLKQYQERIREATQQSNS